MVLAGTASGPGVALGLTGEFIFYSWLENVSGTPRRGQNLWQGIKYSGLTFSACCHYNTHQEGKQEIENELKLTLSMNLLAIGLSGSPFKCVRF